MAQVSLAVSVVVINVCTKRVLSHRCGEKQHGLLSLAFCLFLFACISLIVTLCIYLSLLMVRSLIFSSVLLLCSDGFYINFIFDCRHFSSARNLKLFSHWKSTSMREREEVYAVTYRYAAILAEKTERRYCNEFDFLRVARVKLNEIFHLPIHPSVRPSVRPLDCFSYLLCKLNWFRYRSISSHANRQTLRWFDSSNISTVFQITECPTHHGAFQWMFVKQNRCISFLEQSHAECYYQKQTSKANA